MSVIIRLLVSKGMELSQISSHYIREMQHELCANLQGGFWCRALHCELVLSHVRGEELRLLAVGWMT